LKEFPLIVILLVVVGFILDYFLKQIFNIQKQEKSERKRPKRMDGVVKSVLAIIFIGILVGIFRMKHESYDIVRLLLPFAFISTLYDSLSLWIYDRASKQWIRVLSQAILWLILWISYLFM